MCPATCNCIRAVVDSKSSRSNLAALKPILNYDKLPLMIFVNKGIEMSTQSMTLEIIADELGPEVAKVATFLVSTSSDKSR